MLATMYKIPCKYWKTIRLGDPYRLHQIVYNLFSKSQRDFLFLDKGNDCNEKKILIISKEPPSIPEYGEVLIKKIPETFLQQNRYRFETVLNPVKTVRNDDGSTTKKPIIGAEQLLKWFSEKSKGWGFQVEFLRVSNMHVLELTRKGECLILNSCTFSGKFIVTNRLKFIESFEKGVGRSRGFGFGLLQLFPIN